MDFINKENTSFVVIDVQERLMGAMPEDITETNLKNMKILLEAAKILGIPVTVTEQYPKGLGPTIEEIKESVGEGFRGVQIPLGTHLYPPPPPSRIKQEIEVVLLAQE